MEKEYTNKAPYGSLFGVKSKTNANAPDYYGEVVIELSQFDVVDGAVRISLGGWKKPLSSGNGTYLSLRASKPFVKTQAVVEDDEDVPF